MVLRLLFEKKCRGAQQATILGPATPRIATCPPRPMVSPCPESLQRLVDGQLIRRSVLAVVPRARRPTMPLPVIRTRSLRFARILPGLLWPPRSCPYGSVDQSRVAATPLARGAEPCCWASRKSMSARGGPCPRTAESVGPRPIPIRFAPRRLILQQQTAEVASHLRLPATYAVFL